MELILFQITVVVVHGVVFFSSKLHHSDHLSILRSDCIDSLFLAVCHPCFLCIQLLLSFMLVCSGRWWMPEPHSSTYVPNINWSHWCCHLDHQAFFFPVFGRWRSEARWSSASPTREAPTPSPKITSISSTKNEPKTSPLKADLNASLELQCRETMKIRTKPQSKLRSRLRGRQNNMTRREPVLVLKT